MKVTNVKRYQVTGYILTYWRGRYGSVPSCRLCDREFVEGDDVISRAIQKAGWSKRKYYHAGCLEEGSVSRIRGPREASGDRL